MQRNFYIGIVAIVFVFGTIVAVIPPAKASPAVRVYVKDPTDGDSTYAAWTGEKDVEVWIETPETWTNTADGIVAYFISVRYDPRVLGPPATAAWAARKFPTLTAPGWLESFMMTYYEEGTSELTEVVDAVSGMYYGWGEAGPLGATTGAGGSGKLMRFRFTSLSSTNPSPIDLVKQGTVIPPTGGSVEVAMYLVNAKNEKLYADTVDDGWYIGSVTDIFFMGVTSWGGSVPGTILHEEWPMWSHEYRIDSHTDTDGDGAMDASEQIDTFDFSDESLDWWHVEWVNPDPKINDGIVDVILKGPKIVPEFPLGLGILMTAVAAIPVAYLWRVRKKSR